VIDYVRDHADRFGVEPICRVLTEHGVPIAPSTYYAHAARGFGPSVAELEDAYAANDLYRLWTRNRRLYGRRKLWKAARRAGLDLGRDRVERLMRIAGISGIRRGKHRIVTTERDERAPRHPDHVKRAWSWPTRPDQWWVADFTYVWTTAGFCYVSFITDVCSRRILGWRVSTSKATPLVLSALEQALFTRRRTSFEFTTTGLLHHSDAGSQYTSLAFTEALLEAGITGSIGSVGDALDNALMESTIGLFKTEVIEHERPIWSSWRQVEEATASWVHWYNHDRLHSSIGDVPPVEHEQAYDSPRGHGEPAAA
jgi:putative transposase